MRYFLLIFLFSFQVLAQTTLDSPQNVIINGGMDIWQRGVSFTSATGNNVYGPDRFWMQKGSTDQAVVTLARSTDIPAGTYGYSPFIEVATKEDALAADEFFMFNYAVEGLNTKYLLGKYVTLAFSVKSSLTGTTAVAFVNSAGDRTLIKDYTINSANTWEEKYISFYFDPTGTWLIDDGIGLRIRFSLACGTDWDDGTDGAWVATNEICTAASQGFNLIATAGNHIRFKNIRLYAGTQKKPFVLAGGTIAGELAMAQRYYWRQTLDRNVTNSGATPTTLYLYSANALYFNVFLPTPMRAQMTCDLGGVAATAWDVYTFATGSPQSFTSSTARLSDDKIIGQVLVNKTSHGISTNSVRLLLLTTAGYLECSAEY